MKARGHGPLCMHQYGMVLEAFRGTWFVHMLNRSESVWRAQNITVFTVDFDQINASLVSRKTSFKNIKSHRPFEQ